MANSSGKINWFKVFFIIAAIYLLFTWFKSCKAGDDFFGCSRGDTISVKRDTIIRIDSSNVSYIPIPVHVEVPTVIHVPGKDIIKYEKETIEIPVDADTAAILQRYYTKRYYVDTINRGSAWIRISDTVTQNKIVGRGVIVTVRDTLIRETITLTQPKRMVVYFGVSAMGMPKTPFYAIGGQLSLKGKNDKIYGVGAFLNKDGEVMYQAEYKIPIRLSKNRR